MARAFLILNQLELNGFRGQSIQLTFGLSFTLTTTHEPVEEVETWEEAKK